MNLPCEEVAKIPLLVLPKIRGIQNEFLVVRLLVRQRQWRLDSFLRHSERTRVVRFVSLQVCVELSDSSLDMGEILVLELLQWPQVSIVLGILLARFVMLDGFMKRRLDKTQKIQQHFPKMSRLMILFGIKLRLLVSKLVFRKNILPMELTNEFAQKSKILLPK